MNCENVQVKDYFKLHSEYEEKYGKMTLVLMQVGGFYEAYCTNEVGPDLDSIAMKINMVKTGKNKSKPISISNPFMMGFPLHSLPKYLEMLIEFNYIIIVIDQVSPPPKPVRKVRGIYTPSTFVESVTTTKNNKFLVSINIEEEFDIDKQTFISAGMSSVDLSTGELYIYECFSKLDDKMFSIDEVQRFLKQFSPVELILCINNGKNQNLECMSYDDLINFLDVEDINIYLQNEKDIKTRTKISYQNSVFNKIYPGNNILSSIEILKFT
jgi:DNA mismatch repair protein MutS